MTPAATAAPARAPMAAVPAGAPVQYAGFWIRVVAVLIDGILINLVVWPIMMLVGGIGGAAVSSSQDPGAALAVILGMMSILFPVLIVGGWLYEAFTTSSSWQGTVGKKILGLKVTDEAGNRITFARASGRHFSKIVSGMILYIGFIMAGFTDRKRALHDMIAGTLVVKK
jgi:uncharacterized RDD family membrane protein YckC